MAHTTLTSLFTDIADAIRAKTGSSAAIVADDFPTEIASIPSGGGGLVLITTLPDYEIAFEDTEFATWTPSTTAKAILATQTLGTFTASTLANYDYFVRQRIFVDVQYKSGTSTAKGMFQFCAGENWNCITRRANTATLLNSGSVTTNLNESITTSYLLKYYNTSWTALYSSAYGIYPTNTAPSLSSTTAASPTITVKSAVINAKCQATYFSTAMAANVDQAASTIKIKTDIYRAEGGYMRRTVNRSLADMWLHKL